SFYITLNSGNIRYFRMYIKEREKVMDRSQALALVKKIVQINSVNPPGNETLVADELKKLFEEHGIETELVEYSEGRCNLIATLNGSSAGKVLGFTGHMDVVPPRSEEHTSELQSHFDLVCRLLLEKKNEKVSATLWTIGSDDLLQKKSTGFLA